jgi:acylphosphatase
MCIKKKAHVIISGRVQGVFYRDSTKQKAEQLNVKGWVRNLNNGSVEAVFEGDEKAVNDLIKWCYKGSRLAKVIDVDVNFKTFSNEFNSFSVRYD